MQISEGDEKQNQGGVSNRRQLTAAVMARLKTHVSSGAGVDGLTRLGIAAVRVCVCVCVTLFVCCLGKMEDHERRRRRRRL